jgi:hypothetical protein
MKNNISNKITKILFNNSSTYSVNMSLLLFAYAQLSDLFNQNIKMLQIKQNY